MHSSIGDIGRRDFGESLIRNLECDFGIELNVNGGLAESIPCADERDLDADQVEIQKFSEMRFTFLDLGWKGTKDCHFENQYFGQFISVAITSS
jgi:hypothetical protein